MIIRSFKAARASDRRVEGRGWESVRLLLKDDAMGFSFHITTMYAGEEIRMHYRHHLEAVFVIRGEGSIEDLATGEIHPLRSGDLYALNAHDRHIVRPRTDLVVACTFTPPVTGREVHDETGAYPLEADAAPVREAAL